MPVLAILHASQDEAEKAVELLALAFTHPQSPTGWMENWLLLKQWQLKLEAELGTERYKAAWERGMTLELGEVFKNIPF